ncbi:MAG: glycosyl hydrolase 53 family protein [bacterium]
MENVSRRRLAGLVCAVGMVTVLVASCATGQSNEKWHRGEFLNGADISSTPALEDKGVVYRDSLGEADILTILDRHGFNSIRLKIWHTPKEGYNDLAHVAAMAQRIREHKMHFLLNFHYSDWWADPQKQITPEAWKDLPCPTLKDSLYQYTRNVLSTLDKQGTPPQMVQIGNEIRPGMLWPLGRVDEEYDTAEQWDRLAELLAAARQGVLDGLSKPEDVTIMIHFDNGGKNSICRKFFDSLAVRDVAYDVIGLSFYPRWHGFLDSLEVNLADLSQRYDKDVIVVETAYPFTLGWNDDQGNIMGSESDLHEGYPPTLEGQAAFFRELRRIVTSVPDNRGKGLYYWEPGLIPAQGMNSPWENVTLFNFDGMAVPAMDVFTGRK